jgi:hypothetical protein
MAGDEEAMYYDADYIRALEYGMPPDRRLRHRHRPPGDAADRQRPSIRDVILFPALRRPASCACAWRSRPTGWRRRRTGHA